LSYKDVVSTVVLQILGFVSGCMLWGEDVCYTT